MKRFIKWGIATLVCGMILLFNPINVQAESYYWAEGTETAGDGGTIKVAGWYKYAPPSSTLAEKMDNAPENLTSNDTILIQCEPNDECKKWLQSLSGAIGIRINSSFKGDVQIGSADSVEPLQIAELRVSNGKNMVVYADVVDLVTTTLENLTLYGNVTGTLELGNTHSNVQESIINISGNVEAINWYKKELIHNAYTGTDYYVGFAGTVAVGGTVNNGAIYSLYDEEALGAEVWRQTGAFGACETGTFQMTTGELAEAVNVTTIKPQPGNYKFQYTITNNGKCVKSAYNAETNASVATFACDVSDIPDGATVSVSSTAPGQKTVINADLEMLTVSITQGTREINVTVDGDVKNLHVICGILNNGCEAEVMITGDVANASVRENPGVGCNVFVQGTVASGRAMPVVGTYALNQFTCNNIQVLKNGEIGPGIFLKKALDNSSIGYQPLTKQEKNIILSNEEIGTEITVTTQNGDKTIVKTAGVDVAETEQEKLTELKEAEELQNALDKVQEDAGTDEKTYVAEAIGALEINVNTYYEDKATGAVYSDDPQYSTQAVTNLSDGKALAFTVKVPIEQYDENAEYTIVRKHTNEDGSTSIEELETTQNGDVLEFNSDKFSTFVIVEMKVSDKPSEPETPSEPEQPSEPETPSEPEKPSEPEEPSEPEQPSEPETPDESDENVETVVVEKENITVVEATETGNASDYVLWCGILLSAILGMIALKKRMNMF